MAMGQAWEQRHLGIPEQPHQALPFVNTRCFMEGCCHCANSCRGRVGILQKFVTAVLDALKSWQASVVIKNFVADGWCLAVWEAVAAPLEDGDADVDWRGPVQRQMFIHIPLLYQRPWRPTLFAHGACLRSSWSSGF